MHVKLELNGSSQSIVT